MKKTFAQVGAVVPMINPFSAGRGFGEEQGPAFGLAYCPGGAVCGTTRSQPERHSRTYG